MKKSSRTYQLLPIIIGSVVLFSSCSKNANSIASNENENAEMYSSKNLGNTTLVLRPSINGQDACVYKLESDPNSANGNSNSIPELGASKWTNGGSPETKRFFIQFKGLSKIPDTAIVISATLQFKGLTSSLSTPQGNSIYPGTPYNAYPDNSCLVQRVKGKWNEATITWNNQPPITELNQAVIASSNSRWNYNPVIDVTKMVQLMVQNPTTNNGFKISLSNENIYRSLIFGSSEATSTSDRPTLTIIYSSSDSK